MPSSLVRGAGEESNMHRLDDLLTRITPGLRESVQAVVCDVYMPLEVQVMSALAEAAPSKAESTRETYLKITGPNKLDEINRGAFRDLITRNADGGYVVSDLPGHLTLKSLYVYLDRYIACINEALAAIKGVYDYCVAQAGKALLTPSSKKSEQAAAQQFSTIRQNMEGHLKEFAKIQKINPQVLRFIINQAVLEKEVRVEVDQESGKLSYHIPVRLVDDGCISANLILDNDPAAAAAETEYQFVNCRFIDSSLFQSPDSSYRQLVFRGCQGQLNITNTHKELKIVVIDSPRLNLTLTGCAFLSISIKNQGGSAILSLIGSRVESVVISGPINSLNLIGSHAHVSLNKAEVEHLLLTDKSQASLFTNHSQVMRLEFDGHLYLISRHCKFEQIRSASVKLMVCYLSDSPVREFSIPEEGIHQAIDSTDLTYDDEKQVKIFFHSHKAALKFELPASITHNPSEPGASKSRWKPFCAILCGSESAFSYFTYNPNGSYRAQEVALLQSLPLLMLRRGINLDETALAHVLYAQFPRKVTPGEDMLEKQRETIIRNLNQFILEQAVNLPEERGAVLARMPMAVRTFAIDYVDHLLRTYKATSLQVVRAIANYKLESTNFKLLGQMLCLLRSYQPGLLRAELKEKIKSEVIEEIQAALNEAGIDWRTAVARIKAILAEKKQRYPQAVGGSVQLQSFFTVVVSIISFCSEAVETSKSVDALLRASHHVPRSFQLIMGRYNESCCSEPLPAAVAVAVQEVRAEYTRLENIPQRSDERLFFAGILAKPAVKRLEMVFSDSYRHRTALVIVVMIANSYQPVFPFGIGGKKLIAMQTIARNAKTALANYSKKRPAGVTMKPSLKDTLSFIIVYIRDLQDTDAVPAHRQDAGGGNKSRPTRGFEDTLARISILAQAGAAGFSSGGASDPISADFSAKRNGMAPFSVVVPPIETAILNAQKKLNGSGFLKDLRSAAL